MHDARAVGGADIVVDEDAPAALGAPLLGIGEVVEEPLVLDILEFCSEDRQRIARAPFPRFLVVLVVLPVADMVPAETPGVADEERRPFSRPRTRNSL